VHGMTGKYNQYLFDGMSGKEMQHETNIFSPSIDAIQEIKIETSNYDAEFGAEAGGHVNVVIKSGTNQLHGALYEFLRNDAVNAKEKYADRKAELRRNTFGGTIGGPIKKDKTFYFGSWESMRLRQASPRTPLCQRRLSAGRLLFPAGYGFQQSAADRDL